HPPQLNAAQEALDAAVRVADEAAAASETQGTITPQGAVRIALLRARLAGLTGDRHTERMSLVWVVDHHPEFAGMAAPGLLAHARAEGRLGEALDELQTTYAEHPSQDLFDAIFEGLY